MCDGIIQNRISIENITKKKTRYANEKQPNDKRHKRGDILSKREPPPLTGWREA